MLEDDVKHIFEVNEDKLGFQNSPTDELLISAPVRSHSGQFSHCPTSPLPTGHSLANLK